MSGQSQTTFRQFVHAAAPSPWLGRGSGASMGGLTPASYIDDHVAMIDPAASGDGCYQYYHVDALFNTMAMTNAAGAATEWSLYEPYGTATLTNGDFWPIAVSALGNPFERQGIIRDWETGNDDNRHQAWNSHLGRALQRIGIRNAAGALEGTAVIVASVPARDAVKRAVAPLPGPKATARPLAPGSENTGSA